MLWRLVGQRNQPRGRDLRRASAFLSNARAEPDHTLTRGLLFYLHVSDRLSVPLHPAQNPATKTVPVPAPVVSGRIETTCAAMKNAFESNCCGASESTTMYPYVAGGGDIFAKGGSHLSHAESFSGTKIQALITASECVDVMPSHNWQADPRSPHNKFCAVGAMDGLNALPVIGDGTFQTPNTGRTYMRTFVNTEITRAPNDPRTPSWYISTNPNKGGYGQPAPDENEKLKMYGAMEFFVDYDRQTLEPINGGQAIKKVYTANRLGFNTAWSATAKASDIYGIVTDYSMLHNNVQPSMTARYSPDCSATSSSRSCGLNGHCGSKMAPKHEFSYNVNGAPAYGAASGVGFEDDVLLVAEEGHPMASWGASDAITGTVQVLDVRTGDFYQLPHLSVGVIEMAFTISTGHPDFIAVGIEEYGISGSYNGTTGGSRWSVWIGKKDRTAGASFLDRNGLAPNCGRIYVFTANSAEQDMATFLEWPQSGVPSHTFTPKQGSFKPVAGMFDGRYSHWFAAHVNTLPTTDGSMPVRMTARGKQEWGAVNPDQPNQWAIAETGLGGSTGGRSRGCQTRDANCPMGTSSSTVSFLQAEFVTAFSNAMSGATTSRDGTVFPDAIPAQVNGVMADQVYMGPHRGTGSSPTGLGQRGFAGVDSLLWLKGGNILASEDSYGPGGFNMGVMYNIASKKAVPIVGAISRYGITMGKMNAAAMAPYGSFSGSTNQEMTGFFDASATLSVPILNNNAGMGITPQQYYDAHDATHIIVNNQMKGGAGPMQEGFYYASQTHFLELPTIDWATYPTCPHVLNQAAEAHWVTAYGRFRRLAEEDADAVYDVDAVEDDWTHGHDDFDTTHH